MTRYHCDGCGKEWIEGYDSYKIEIRECSSCKFKHKRKRDVSEVEK